MRRIRRKSAVDYLLPFLVLVGLGIVVVLGFQVWTTLKSQGKADAYFYVVQGKAKILPFGQKDWDPAFSGTHYLLGDSLKTSIIGKAVISFFNGTLVRLGDDTSVTLKDISKSSDSEKIALNLDNGMVWINARKSDGVKEASYEIYTAHMVVRAKGTTFEVENRQNEVVRVFSDEVKVDILINSNGTKRVADTINVGVGQEITLDEATLNAFAQNQSPSVLQAVSDQFKTTDWYQWNRSEDASPTQFGFESEQVNSTQDTSSTFGLTQQSLQSTQESQDLLNNSQEFNEIPKAPIVLTPAGGKITITQDKYLLTGTVQQGTEKVLITQVKDGKTDTYTLSKFKSGDTNWSYNLAVNLGNLQSGENTYSVYAVDITGKKSPASVITIIHNKTPTETQAQIPLETPSVLSFNGGQSNVTTTGVVKVIGQVKGADKIVVNDLTLKKFKPGDSNWIYFANENGDNLHSGLNEYQVYAIDAQGNKSGVYKFTITYNKPGVSSTSTVPAGVSGQTQETSQ